jgi:hypothetical protein
MSQPSLAPVAIGATVVLAVGLVVAGGVALANPQGCESPFEPGKASTLVTVSTIEDGGSGVVFPTPLKTTGRELTVVTAGEGEPAAAGHSVDFDVSAFLGSTGEFLVSTSYDPRNPSRRVIDSESSDFFAVILECAVPGSSLVVTSTVEDVFGAIPEDDVVKNDSTVVLVIDVRATYLPKADGRPRLPQSGLPTVVLSPEGVHGVSFPNSPPPTELRVSVLKQGTGEAIAEGDFVTAHFTGLTWNLRSVFVSSFSGGAPLSVIAADSTQAEDGQGVIPGLAQALIGQTVGSQILISIPPSLGYPSGQAPPGVPENATLVYIFDILGTQR